MRKNLLFHLSVLASMVPLSSRALDVNLVEVAFNDNGTIYDTLFGDPLTTPTGVTLSPSFASTGLGTISWSINGPGIYGIFFDHELGLSRFDDNISVSGTLQTGQTWEADEPGYVDGDIFSLYNPVTDSWDDRHFINSTVTSALDNAIRKVDGTDAHIGVDDFSVALLWEVIGAGTLTVNVSLTQPGGADFVIRQFDADNPVTPGSIYITGRFSPGTPPPPGVPDAGSSAVLFLIGIAAMTLLKPARSLN